MLPALLFAALAWDDYIALTAFACFLALVGAAFEWRRQGRERDLDDARHDRNVADAEQAAARILELEILARVQAAALDRQGREHAELVARVLELEIAARVAAELGAGAE